MEDLSEIYTKASQLYGEKNYKNSLDMFLQAADRNYPNAMYNAAYIYEHGEGIPKDLELAFYWYNRGAIKGHLSCMKRLAEMFSNGAGTKKDKRMAYYWSSKAHDDLKKSRVD